MPISGATPGDAARRELREETGLALAFEAVASPSADVALYVVAACLEAAFPLS